jgi:hypothetical protein
MTKYLLETLDKWGPPRAYDPLFPIKLWFNPELWSLFGSSACFASAYAIFVLFGLVAPEKFHLSPLYSGLYAALFGLGCFTGSQLGGEYLPSFLLLFTLLRPTSCF